MVVALGTKNTQIIQKISVFCFDLMYNTHNKTKKRDITCTLH